MQKNRFLLTFLLLLFTCLSLQAQSLVCNDRVEVSLYENCEFVLLGEHILEGGCFCPQGTRVEIDKVAPFGNGPWSGPQLTKADVGKTYAGRVIDIATNQSCWVSGIKVTDKLPPKLICKNLVSVYLNADTMATLPVEALYLTATDECSTPVDLPVFIQNSPSPVNFDGGDLGLNTFTLSTADASGNKATCNVNVLVLDTLNVSGGMCIAQCPPSTVVTYEQGIGVLLPALQVNNLAPFEAYDTLKRTNLCTSAAVDYTVTYHPAATGYASFRRHWDITAGGVSVGSCQQTIAFPATHTFSFSGKVFVDATPNCQVDPTEKGANVFAITGTKLPGMQKFTVMPDSTGVYDLKVEMSALDSAVVVKIELPNDIQANCAAVYSIPNQPAVLQQTLNFGLPAAALCPKTEVSIGSLFFRKCADNPFHIWYCNSGYGKASNVSIQVKVDPLMSLTSPMPFTQNGQISTFQVGDIPPKTCKSFPITINVSCNAVLRQTLCVEATIFPPDTCTYGRWTGPFVETSAACDGDSVRLIIRNNGNGDMQETLHYIVVEDIIMRGSGMFKLAAGDSTVMKVPANGATWRIEAEQVPDYPIPDRPAAFMEACGGLNTPGLVNAFPLNDMALNRDIECFEVTQFWLPNSLTAVPSGYGPDHTIDANTNIDYKVVFRNSSSGIVNKLTIVDTISPFLDPASIQVNIASHPYVMEIGPAGVVRFIFENINLQGSGSTNRNGFLNFRISQKPNVPIGTQITNRAAIYFDSTGPIFTNKTLHTIGTFKVLTQVYKPYVPEMGIKIAPNPFGDRAIFEVTGIEMHDGVLRLYDMQGRAIQSRIFTGNQCEIERNNLPSGLYFFQISRQGLPVGSGKIEVH